MLGAAVPLCVKVAVHVFASTCTKLLSVPPATTTSDAVNPATSSLNWKVIVEVSPAPNSRSELVIVSVGAVVSTVSVNAGL